MLLTGVTGLYVVLGIKPRSAMWKASVLLFYLSNPFQNSLAAGSSEIEQKGTFFSRQIDLDEIFLVCLGLVLGHN